MVEGERIPHLNGFSAKCQRGRRDVKSWSDYKNPNTDPASARAIRSSPIAFKTLDLELIRQ